MNVMQFSSIGVNKASNAVFDVSFATHVIATDNANWINPKESKGNRAVASKRRQIVKPCIGHCVLENIVCNWLPKFTHFRLDFGSIAFIRYFFNCKVTSQTWFSWRCVFRIPSSDSPVLILRTANVTLDEKCIYNTNAISKLHFWIDSLA